jgi:hypothetical protein
MGFMNILREIFSEANEEFKKNVSVAWDELKTGLKEVSQAQYLRLGAVFRRKASAGIWQYGIYLGFDEILTTDEDGTVICCDSFDEFADAEKLYVAAENHIALGGHKFIKNALLIKEDPPIDISSRELVKACLDEEDCATVAEALRAAHGSFQWLEYVPMPKDNTEDEDEVCEEGNEGEEECKEEIQPEETE